MEPATTYWTDELPAPQSDDPWQPNQPRSASIKTVSSLGLVHALTHDFAMVNKGRELTRKLRRLPSNLVPFDQLIGGGLPRGRISEIVGGATSGKTSAAAAFAAAASRMGETVAWIDSTNTFDPPSHSRSGADLSRVLWVNPARLSPDFANLSRRDRRDALRRVLRTGELILDAGGFALAVIDLCINPYPLAHSTALRLARLAERSSTSVLILAERRICGTFAALSLSFNCPNAIFNQSRYPPSSIVRTSTLFDRLTIQTRIIHNKMSDGGALGSGAIWNAVADVSDYSQTDQSVGLITIPVLNRATAHSR